MSKANLLHQRRKVLHKSREEKRMDITKRKCQETNQPLLTAKSVTKVRALQLFKVPGSTNTQIVDNTTAESTSTTNKSEASNKCEESPLIVSIGNT